MAMFNTGVGTVKSSSDIVNCHKCRDSGEIQPTQVGDSVIYCNCKTGLELAKQSLEATINAKPFQN